MPKIQELYDKAGNLLSKIPMKMPSLKETVEAIKTNPNAVFSTMGIRGSGRLDAFIAQAKEKGAIVEDQAMA